MQVAVLRHAHHESDALTERGRAAAVAAGEWLRAHGFRPDVLVHTRSQRTLDTGLLALEAAGAPSDLPVRRRSGLPRDPAGWQRLLEELEGFERPLIVCHHTTQRLVERELGGRGFEVPQDNRGAVFLVDRVTCVAAWPGTPRD